MMHSFSYCLFVKPLQQLCYCTLKKTKQKNFLSAGSNAWPGWRNLKSALRSSCCLPTIRRNGPGLPSPWTLRSVSYTHKHTLTSPEDPGLKRTCSSRPRSCPGRFLSLLPASRCVTWRCLSPSSTTVTTMSSNGCGTSAAPASTRPAARVQSRHAANWPLLLPSLPCWYFFSPLRLSFLIALSHTPLSPSPLPN